MRNIKLAVYVPSTINGAEPAPSDQIDRWVKAAKIKLSALCGGFTAVPGMGGWVSEEHGLIEEPVVIVSAVTDSLGDKVESMRELAKAIALDMSQECVAIEINGELIFVS